MSAMFIISIPENKKRLLKIFTNFQRNILKNSKPNYCPTMELLHKKYPLVYAKRGRDKANLGMCLGKC